MRRATDNARRIDTDALKRDRPLADVIASYGIVLQREGAGRYRALCPFHEERTPSLWIDARDDGDAHYHCFGCAAHGDSITFVMERESCSFQEACERLRTRERLPVVEPSAPQASKATGVRWDELPADSTQAETLELAIRTYEEQLWSNRRACDYLEARAIPEEVARRQRLGYADGRGLLHRLQSTAKNAHLLETAVSMGLLLQRDDAVGAAPRRREFFFDRLIIPELRQGRPIWCIGRAIEDPPTLRTNRDDGAPSEPDVPGPRVRPRPKYLGLPGVKPVLGLEHVLGRNVAYVMEGPVDWLAAVGWGLPAFAICGTHFPAERLPKLPDAVAVYGVFDPDRAGQSAAERYGPLYGSRWRPVRLPNGLDLAELAALGAAGREHFETLVGRARAAAWQRASD